MYLYLGIIVHIATGAGMRLLFGWRFGVVAAIFAAKEMGELKYKLPGSVKSLDKNIAMISELFLSPAILAQWALPALAVWLIDLWLGRRNRL
ncbi:MAG: hypothetical protein ACK5NG_11675 [Chthoniobacterales bacterium]